MNKSDYRWEWLGDVHLGYVAPNGEVVARLSQSHICPKVWTDHQGREWFGVENGKRGLEAVFSTDGLKQFTRGL